MDLLRSTGRAREQIMQHTSSSSNSNGYDPLDPAVQREPYPFYAALRRDEPVKWLPSIQAYAVARYDHIDALLRSWQLFSSAHFWSEILGEYDPIPEIPPMLSMDAPQHTALRRLANKAFVPSKISALHQTTVDITNE